MSLHSDSVFYLKTRPVSAIVASSLLISIGIFNLAFYFTDPHGWATFFPYSPPMSLTSSIIFVLIGSSLVARAIRCHKWVYRLATTALGTIVAMPFLVWLHGPAETGMVVYSDNLLTRLTEAMMCVLILTNARWANHRIYLYDWLATIYTLIPLLTVFAYIFEPVAMYDNYPNWVIAMPTAIAQAFAFLGLIMQNHSKGAAGLFTRQTYYGKNFRRLFIMMLVIPLAIGSSLALAVEFNWLRAGFAAAVFCLCSTLIIVTALANNALVQDNWVKRLLREQEKNQALQSHISEVLELSPDAIVLIDRTMRILHANQGASQLFGYQASVLSTLSASNIVINREPGTFERLLETFFSSRRRSLRERRPVHVTIQNERGETIAATMNLTKRQSAGTGYVVAVFRNAAETAARISHLEAQVRHDALTGAGSRSEFDSYCDKLARGQRRNEGLLAVMILDIDNFKLVNDTYGHPEGDRVLQSFADTVKSCLRQHDQLFRIGGEEFAIVATQIDNTNALNLAERIREAVSQVRVRLSQSELSITCSIGVCIAKPDTIHRSISFADRALYRAKHSGKNRVELYEQHERAS